MRAQWEAWQQREGRAQAVALPPHARASRFFSPLNRSTKPNVRHRCNAPPARMRPGPAARLAELAVRAVRWVRRAVASPRWALPAASPRRHHRHARWRSPMTRLRWNDGAASSTRGRDRPRRSHANAERAGGRAPCCGSAPTPSSALAPNALAPNALAPKALAPYALAPITLAPNALAPYALAPYAMAPYALTPNALAPNALAPNALAPNALAPYALAPYALAPNTLAPYALAPYAMAPYALVPNALAPNALPPNALAP
ncbi:unnamed protein product [Closterium sp. NIES-64]|nr:unnamed protein product [Closterium sp. NIES-64]